ncbi:MAG TPA: methyltransferase domain-containing protein [Phycisphaerales bacterium]|nr:methyltransferase domain-containing protein [Phycisphaerales bacterium]
MTYTKRWFAGQVTTSEASAAIVVPIVTQLLKPASMIDVGCGLAGWAAAFGKSGVPEVMGVDGDYVDRSMLRIPADRFTPHDLTKPLTLDRTFDLAISLEVAEHLPESVADQFVQALTNLAPAVLFSAAVPAQGGNHHVNEQWQSYWAEKFAARGYRVADPVRPRIWDNEDVQWWYRQNTLLFLSDPLLATRPDLQGLVEDARTRALDVVHPRMLEQLVDAASHPMRTLVRRHVIRAKQVARKIKGG